MEYRQLGHSDLKLPVVSFGAWAIGGWLWGGTDDAAAIRAIHCATDVGITCIDTAPTYGMGHSETIVGKAIAGRRDKVIVATKCGVRWDLAEGQFSMDTKMNDGTSCKLYRNLRPNAIKYECDQSLRRLGVDVIDLGMVMTQM
ncbi:MAG: aldo/keto reductase, partial [Candidatus Hydrogenedentes bacterium]|nr:aldo/keto reductase [Candidatus Hydrogenedentota bacterium]